MLENSVQIVGKNPRKPFSNHPSTTTVHIFPKVG